MSGKVKKMAKCDCYYQHGTKFVCYGTKEMEECSCGGNESKCNFYPEKRKPKMANEKRLIELDHALQAVAEQYTTDTTERELNMFCDIRQRLREMPTVDAYTAHEVAEIIADLFGDTCACNFNRIDEWLPEKCELLDACPNTVGVACWEQYLKYRSAKMDGDGNG